jgi:hypothetical protein
MNKKLKIQSTVYPETQLSQQEWMTLHWVSSGYVKPTQYYTENHFQPVIKKEQNFINRILNSFRKNKMDSNDQKKPPLAPELHASLPGQK